MVGLYELRLLDIPCPLDFTQKPECKYPGCRLFCTGGIFIALRTIADNSQIT